MNAGPPASPVLDAALGWLAAAAAKSGALVTMTPIALDAALTDTGDDAVICVGGTSSGHRDVERKNACAARPREVHGIAISPGETAALGFAGKRPILLVPGRFDAALAVWLLLDATSPPSLLAAALSMPRKPCSSSVRLYRPSD